jgi:hypothetical protein
MVVVNRRHTGRSLLRSTIGLPPLQGFNELLPVQDNEALGRVDEDLAFDE